MGFFDFSFKDIAGPLVTAGTTLAGGLFAQGQAADAANVTAQAGLDEIRLKHANDIEILKLRHALGAAGGGGGGAGGPFLGFTDPQKVQAIQAQNKIYLDALNSLIAGYQGALRGGR